MLSLDYRTEPVNDGERYGEAAGVRGTLSAFVNGQVRKGPRGMDVKAHDHSSG